MAPSPFGSAGRTLLEEYTVRALYEFLYATINQHYTFGSLFDAVSAASLCVGVALAVRHLRTRWARFLLIWFVVALAVTTPLNYAPAVSDTRSLIVVPPAALLAALGLCAAVRGMWRHLGWTRTTGDCGAMPCGRAGGGGGAQRRSLLQADAATAFLEHHRHDGRRLTQHADADVVLGGDLANNNLCQLLDGYQIDPARALRFSAGLLTPQCMPPTPRPVTRRPVQFVALSSQGRGAMPQCTKLLQFLLVAPNKYQMLGAIALVCRSIRRVRSHRLAQAVAQVCPGLRRCRRPDAGPSRPCL